MAHFRRSADRLPTAAARFIWLAKSALIGELPENLKPAQFAAP